MITSLLDTDFYKFTMGQFILHKQNSAWVKYKYKCRKGNGLPEGKEHEFVKRLNYEVDCLCCIKIPTDEINYLKSISLFKVDYIEFLRLLKLNRDYIKIYLNEDENELDITIEGPWLYTTWFEVPILAIISELNTEYAIEKESKEQNLPQSVIKQAIIENATTLFKYKVDKIEVYAKETNSIPAIMDFGTRRRACFTIHEEIIKEIITANKRIGDSVGKKNAPFIGTSNVLFAMNYGLNPTGTHAHECWQAYQTLTSPYIFQKAFLNDWMEEYRGNLGIALSDIIGFSNFLKAFDLYFAKLYNGCRHDSGDPNWWCNKLVMHYESLGIDPKTKTAAFSDGLTIDSIIELHKKWNDTIHTVFGIGTNLTNDIFGIDALQIVIKMVECNGYPVAKISDSMGKGMCEDVHYMDFLKKIYTNKNMD